MRSTTGSVSFRRAVLEPAVDTVAPSQENQIAPANLWHGLISIVVPVWNESALIRPFLKHLHERAAEAEVVVVDGGSSDGTTELAAGFCDQLLRGGRNRGAQMNTGAQLAHGDILWFLHVDVEVPPRCLDEITQTLSDPKVAGGYFRIRLPRDRVIYRLIDSFAHYSGRVLRIRCGDHGIFCRRDIFEKLGGFPEGAIMEDVEFFRRLHDCGRVQYIDKRIFPSPRRYEEVGPVRLTLGYGLIATLYAFGAPLRLLTWLYSRICCRQRRESVSEAVRKLSRSKQE